MWPFKKKKLPKGSFAYGTGSGDDNKSAATILIAEVVALLLIVAIIFAALNYLSIFSLSSMNPKLFGWLPQKGQKLEAVSDVVGYRVSLNNSDSLFQFINQWNLYGNNYSLASGSTKNIPLKSIVIHLVSKDQLTNAYQNNGVTFLSSSLKISPGRFDIYVYLSNSILNDSSKSPIQKGATLTAGTITALARLNEYMINGKNDPTNNFSEVFNRLANDKKTYFLIEKK